jgi:hypothetical protein
MELDRGAARDYIIGREGEALLAADLKDEMQINPECANDILLVDSGPSASEFNDIYLDSYTADCAAGIRDQMV